MDIKTERALVDAFAGKWGEVYACEAERDWPGQRRACEDIEVMRSTLELVGVEWARFEGKGYDMARRRAGMEVA